MHVSSFLYAVDFIPITRYKTYMDIDADTGGLMIGSESGQERELRSDFSFSVDLFSCCLPLPLSLSLHVGGCQN